MNQDMKNVVDEAKPDFESQSTLIDADGHRLESVAIRFSPKDHYGSFRLDPSADVDQILIRATSLEMSDGTQVRVSNLRRCPAFHFVNPHRPHLEFDYE